MNPADENRVRGHALAAAHIAVREYIANPLDPACDMVKVRESMATILDAHVGFRRGVQDFTHRDSVTHAFLQALDEAASHAP